MSRGEGCTACRRRVEPRVIHGWIQWRAVVPFGIDARISAGLFEVGRALGDDGSIWLLELGCMSRLEGWSRSRQEMGHRLRGGGCWHDGVDCLVDGVNHSVADGVEGIGCAAGLVTIREVLY